jgi:hypothetical protein
MLFGRLFRFVAMFLPVLQGSFSGENNQRQPSYERQQQEENFELVSFPPS